MIKKCVPKSEYKHEREILVLDLLTSHHAVDISMDISTISKKENPLISGVISILRNGNVEFAKIILSTGRIGALDFYEKKTFLFHLLSASQFAPIEGIALNILDKLPQKDKLSFQEHLEHKFHLAQAFAKALAIPYLELAKELIKKIGFESLDLRSYEGIPIIAVLVSVFSEKYAHISKKEIIEMENFIFQLINQIFTRSPHAGHSLLFRLLKICAYFHNTSLFFRFFSLSCANVPEPISQIIYEYTNGGIYDNRPSLSSHYTFQEFLKDNPLLSQQILLEKKGL